ncbi:hypothetical protein KR215_007861, partial [Drosophila sulfurigaster]
WFNKVCTQCREQFPKRIIKQHSKKSLRSWGAKLITPEECYASIKSSESEAVNNFVHDDIWWKLPMVLLICGCILVILMAFCFLCQRCVEKIHQHVPPRVDIDICERER